MLFFKHCTRKIINLNYVRVRTSDMLMTTFSMGIYDKFIIWSLEDCTIAGITDRTAIPAVLITPHLNFCPIVPSSRTVIVLFVCPSPHNMIGDHVPIRLLNGGSEVKTGLVV